MTKKLVVISHTHWDREWYLTFQHTRLRLVRLVDQLLGILSADPDYRYFMCDGQTVMLEDYLEVRPERKAELVKRIQEGRLVVGPWYVLADEFLPSGESLIRNLIVGQQNMIAYGAATPGIGYLPDAFGHMAQMPQLLLGFGMDSAVLWRGVPEEIGKSEFIWQGADGSELLTIHLPNGYSNAQALPLQADALLARIALIRNNLESRATTDYLLLMNGNDHVEPQPELPRIIAAANERLQDAELLHGTLPMYVANIRVATNGGSTHLSKVRGELRSVKGAHLLQGVLSARMWVKQQNKAAETLLTRWAEPFTAIANLVGRIPGRHSLPGESGNGRALAPDPQPMLHLAWKYLLQNHAHDSICGCSIDEVYEDVRARFNWSIQIGAELTQQALATIADGVRIDDLPPVAKHDISPEEAESRLAFVVFNSESGPRTDFATFRTKAPVDVSDIVLADDEGNSLPHQILEQSQSELLSTNISRSDLESLLALVSGGDIEVWSKDKIDALESLLALSVADNFSNTVISEVVVKPSLIPGTIIIEISTSEQGRHNYASIAESLHQIGMLIKRGDVEYFQLRISRRDEIEIGFVAREVPGYGYRTYQLLPGHRTRRDAHGPSAGNSIQNEFFLVQASPIDGSLTVIDRETGAVHERLNLFSDGGDAGDEYNFCAPATDRLVESPGPAPVVSLVEDGPARSTLRVDIVLRIPRSLAADRQQRSEDLVDCPITSYVSLYPGVRRIDIRAEVENRSEDHRLRVLFPTKITTDHSTSDHSFAVIDRPLKPASTEKGMEKAMGTYPQHTFVAIGDGRVGLLVASKGLPEFEAIPTQQGTTLALTLLRSVGWLSRDDLTTRQGNAGPSLSTPGAQCLGKHEFHYSLVPHNDGWQTASKQAYWFVNAMRSVESLSRGGELPLKDCFVELGPAVLHLTAIKASEAGDGIIVRFFNPGYEIEPAELKVNLPVESVQLVNLAEQRIRDLDVDRDRRVRLSVAPGEIISLKFVTAGSQDRS